MPETTELSCGKEEGNSCSLPHHTLMQSTICPKALINFYAYCRPVSALKFIEVTLKEADSSGAAPLSLEVALPILCPAQVKDNDGNTAWFAGAFLFSLVPKFASLAMIFDHSQLCFTSQDCRGNQSKGPRGVSPDDEGIRIREVAIIHRREHSQNVKASTGKDECVYTSTPSLQCWGWLLGRSFFLERGFQREQWARMWILLQLSINSYWMCSRERKEWACLITKLYSMSFQTWRNEN